jgi:hypothetical protein
MDQLYRDYGPEPVCTRACFDARMLLMSMFLMSMFFKTFFDEHVFENIMMF